MANLRKKNNIYFIARRVSVKRYRTNVGRSKKLAELALKDTEVKITKNELGRSIHPIHFLFSNQPLPHHHKAIIQHFEAFLERHRHITNIYQFKTF